MKRLSDYQGDAAIELWADLLEPITKIITDEKVKKAVQSGKPPMLIAKEILKAKKKEATQILLRIDSTPLNGLNIIIRLVNVLTEIGANEDVKSFFGYAEQAKTDNVSSGSVMENIEDVES